MRTNRVCSFCGKSYYYCPSCNDKRDPMIYTRYDSKECKNAFDILCKESSNKISTNQAKEELIKLGFSKETKVAEIETKHFNKVINHQETKIETVEITEFKDEYKEKEENVVKEEQKINIPRQNCSKKKNKNKNSEVISLK